MTYTEANEKLGTRQSLWLPGRRNTKLERLDGGIVIRLHRTNVVTFRPCGRVILNSGGWRTVTTKERINRYSGIHVWSERGVWYADDHPFSDGMIFKDGEVVRR